MPSKDHEHEQASLRLTRLDLILQLFLGLVGTVIAVLLGYGQIQLGKLQNNLAKQQIVLQTLTIVSDYLPLVDEKGQNGERARAIIKTAATHLSNEYDSPILAELANSLLEESEIPQTDQAVFQIAEATAPPTSKENWFTVVASFTENQLENAQIKVKEIAGIQQQYKVEIYKTQISEHLAVTLGGKLNKSEALKIAAIARENGWANDAYAQIDRDWTKIE